MSSSLQVACLLKNTLFTAEETEARLEIWQVGNLQFQRPCFFLSTMLPYAVICQHTVCVRCSAKG